MRLNNQQQKEIGKLKKVNSWQETKILCNCLLHRFDSVFVDLKIHPRSGHEFNAAAMPVYWILSIQ